MTNALLFCPCCEALTPVAGLCWNCQHGRCDVCAAEICDRCEYEFGAHDDAGKLVERKVGDVLCVSCRNVRDNADEAAWIQHENDKFFGGGAA